MQDKLMMLKPIGNDFTDRMRREAEQLREEAERLKEELRNA